ncbi:hypothetical protein MTR_0315s0080 [Medicago truncatula]|uniref:Uncharacterized protein n=1 Tax=Medicago truncatula TaxID=3880 RepID=A0A072TFH0_MEDTR|nr:hypothetical protein MTR_0315s0080 [Medicago truncatula]
MLKYDVLFVIRLRPGRDLLRFSFELRSSRDLLRSGYDVLFVIGLRPGRDLLRSGFGDWGRGGRPSDFLREDDVLRGTIESRLGKGERIFDALSLGAKERGFGADSVRKYEDSETKIYLPQVRNLARPVLGLARPCHPPELLLLLLLGF